jgi:hypothetical protein
MRRQRLAVQVLADGDQGARVAATAGRDGEVGEEVQELAGHDRRVATLALSSEERGDDVSRSREQRLSQDRAVEKLLEERVGVAGCPEVGETAKYDSGVLKGGCGPGAG